MAELHTDERHVELDAHTTKPMGHRPNPTRPIGNRPGREQVRPIDLADTTSRSPGTSVAGVIQPLLREVFGEATSLRFVFWDGSYVGPDRGTTAVIHSPDVLRRILWAPGELGIGRAFVAGEVDLEGDIFTALHALRLAVPSDIRLSIGALRSAARAARKLGVLGLPPPPPSEEVRTRGRRHSKHRDQEAISHHYDVGNDFYRLFLGPTMTYSCARFIEPTSTLEEAQTAKHDLICHKLGLDQAPGKHLLDVGCGWGSMAIHAARRYDATVVGITISREQAAEARRRVAEAGMGDRVEIRLQDYRDLGGETFDAISSIGMFEHVGTIRMTEYFRHLRRLTGDRGRVLNHAISSVGGSMLGPRSFIGRYVFPDGELIDVGEVVLAMERAGFEVRDVESLREHYAKTLRAWVGNLEEHWDEAVAAVGMSRARVWRLYMAASAVGFEDGGLSLHQVLGVVSDPDGASGMPPTRRQWG